MTHFSRSSNPVRRFSVLLPCVLLCLGLSAKGENKEISEPQDVISVFYENLLSTNDVSVCPDIFDEPTTLASALQSAGTNTQSAVAVTWRFLRGRKDLFLFRGGQTAEEILNSSSVGYLFTAFPKKTSLFFEGSLTFVLQATTVKGGQEGIYKMIFFPLVRSHREGTRYLINAGAIRVNGALIFPGYDSFRNNEFLHELGFPSSATSAR